MAGITQKSSVASFPLRYLQKQNSWAKKKRKQHEGYYRGFYYCLLALSSKMRNLT